ncbi:limbin isoform X2 [Pseudophryne corroboree]|uniref:limbin isoform X2 n=1 Tax=Pseudophryne corroboree TaxID=495146 RepID=UPI00308164E8
MEDGPYVCMAVWLRAYPFGATLLLMLLYLTCSNPTRAPYMICGPSLLNVDGIQASSYRQYREDCRGLMDDAGPPNATPHRVPLGRDLGPTIVMQSPGHRQLRGGIVAESSTDVCPKRTSQPHEASDLFVTSAAPGTAWTHSLYALMPSWVKRALYKRATVTQKRQPRDVPSSSSGVTFHKCATLNDQGGQQTTSVQLVANNSASAIKLSNVTISDNITGLIIGEVSYNSSTSGTGMQSFRKESLTAGDSFIVSYAASINTMNAQNGLKFSLPAVLTFQNSTEVSAATFNVVVPFSITAVEVSQVLPDHALHFAGFIIAFVVSFLLTCAVFLLLYYSKWFKSRLSGQSHRIDEQKHKPQAKPTDAVTEDSAAINRLIDILALEEPENMLQALDDSEISSITQADAYLEVCRIQVCKDVTGILLRQMASTGSLSPLEERKMYAALSGHWSHLEKRIREEHQRKMVALTAECNLDTRKQMDIQLRRQKEASEEAEGIMKHAEEKSFTEYRSLLDKFHGLEQTEMKRILLYKQEEQFARGYRELTITHRTELHKIFFDQVTHSVKNKPEVQKDVIEDYLKVQVEAEDLLDFLQATKKYHMNKRLAAQKNLLYNIQLGDSRARCLLNSAATQIANLINRTERAGHITDSQAESLLERSQTEVLKVKQKLENVLKQEKRKLHQKLTSKRSRHIAQRLKEQKKELSSTQEVGKNGKEVQPYLEHWRKLFANHCRELEELYEKHDNDATDELKEIKYSLTEKAIEDLRHIQSAVIIQEMIKLNVPRLHLQQVLDEHKRETALLAQQLEKEESDKVGESRASLEITVRKLDDEFKLNLKEQKNLRHWEQLLFMKILLLPLCVSEDDVHKIKQEFYSSFSQMDIPLALPKIQGRMLLQKYLSDWEKAELQKIDQNISEVEKKSSSKTMKHPQDSAAEILKKSVEEKVLIYEAQITDDKIKQARGELLLQRVHQLKAREYTLGEYIASLQFQVVNNKLRALESHSALLQLQSLLLKEEKSKSSITSEYEQLLQTLNQEIREMDRKLENWILKETTINSIKEEDKLHVTVDVSGEEESLPVSATLRKTLNRRKSIISHYRDRMQREQMEYALVEDQEEKAQMDTALRLHNQDIRLAAYLTKRSLVPEGMLHRILSLLLPASPESEISSLLYSVGHKYSDSVTESDSNEDGADSWKKRKQQELWVVLEKQIREGLVNTEDEKGTFSARKKRSILKKKRLRPVKRVSFSHSDSLSKLLQTSIRSEQFGSTESLHLPDAPEKLFIFRAPSVSPTPLRLPSKKRNFLNSKKSNAVFS